MWVPRKCKKYTAVQVPTRAVEGLRDNTHVTHRLFVLWSQTFGRVACDRENHRRLQTSLLRFLDTERFR